MMELASEGDLAYLGHHGPMIAIKGDAPYPVRFQQVDHGQRGPGLIPDQEHPAAPASRSPAARRSETLRNIALNQLEQAAVDQAHQAFPRPARSWTGPAPTSLRDPIFLTTGARSSKSSAKEPGSPNGGRDSMIPPPRAGSCRIAGRSRRATARGYTPPPDRSRFPGGPRCSPSGRDTRLPSGALPPHRTLCPKSYLFPRKRFPPCPDTGLHHCA